MSDILPFVIVRNPWMIFGRGANRIILRFQVNSFMTKRVVKLR